MYKEKTFIEFELDYFIKHMELNPEKNSKNKCSHNYKKDING